MSSAIGLQDASYAAEVAPSASNAPFILPSITAIPAFNNLSSLTPVVCDDRAISKLLEALISRSGLSIGEICRRLGTTSNALRQYLRGRRTKPSLAWFIRLAETCGAKVTIEFPAKR